MFRSPKDYRQGVRQALLKYSLRIVLWGPKHVGVLLEFLAF